MVLYVPARCTHRPVIVLVTISSSTYASEREIYTQCIHIITGALTVELYVRILSLRRTLFLPVFDVLVLSTPYYSRVLNTQGNCQ